MNFNGYSFPHPVLGMGDDISGDAHVTSITNNDAIDKYNYVISIEYSINNDELVDLIVKQKAHFVCELNCTGTLFRKSEICSSFQQTIYVPKNMVRDKVEMLFILVSSEINLFYTNSKMHSDFLGFSFEIAAGDVLAYLGESSFFAGIAYDKLKAVSSFMEIIKGTHEIGDFNIILESQKIQIQLSQKDYEIYCDPRIGKNTHYATMFHSSIVLPTLIHALHQLKKDENIIDYSWAKIIEFRLENDENVKSLLFDEQNIPKIAQLFLGLPFARLLNDLYTQLISNPEDDN